MNIKKLLFCVAFFTLNPCYANSFADKNVIFFVSFSMPDESIKGWIREAKIINAPVVIRGLINDSFKETIHKISVLTKDNHGGVQVDPTLFQRFHIKQVPAIVVVNEPNCTSQMSCLLNYEIVYGDVTLSYALKKIAGQDNDAGRIANHLLTVLREATHA